MVKSSASRQRARRFEKLSARERGGLGGFKHGHEIEHKIKSI